MLTKLFFIMATVSFWVSVGSTEGWKWRMSSGSSDSNKLVNYQTYHLWRFLTSLSVFLMALTSNTKLLAIALAFLAGWPLYERMMSYVEKGSFLAKRGSTWHLTRGIYVPRVSPLMDFIISILALVTYWYYT